MSNTNIQGSGLWCIRLFGSIAVTTPTGIDIPITSKKTGELLAYLALQPGRAHSREKLVDVIWGDSEVGDARARLRQEILSLRSLIAPNDGSPTPLEIKKDSCSLRLETHVDAVRFEEACLLANRESDLSLKRSMFLGAIARYTADLLPGYDSAWIVAERARLSQCLSRALADLAEAQRLLKDFKGAEATLGSLKKHDPLSEECYIALMRLFAELGHPTRVQQQAQAMERALRDGLGVGPTAGSTKLAEELREIAGKRAAALANTPHSMDSAVQGKDSAASMPDGREAERPSAQPGLQPASKRSSYAKISNRLYFVGPAILVVATTAAFGLFHWKDMRPANPGAAAMQPIVERHKESWTYTYELRPGEKPDSEGKAIVGDASGVYVTGLVQTEKDDADILTLKVSHQGRLVWADRYSSPEHDCDRAFSICLDNSNGVFVAGETYVPPHNKDAEGWHLVLLHYDGSGNRLWVRRSPMVKQEGERVQVCTDNRGGCYLGGTALQDGNQLIMVCNYDEAGKMRWQKTVLKGNRTVFGSLAINAGGGIYLCGTARSGRNTGDETDNWLVQSIDPDGKINWTHCDDEPGQGTDTASRIAVDRGGNVFVAGVSFSSGAPAEKGLGYRMALRKYGVDGKLIWRRIVAESGPAVVLEAMSINETGDIAIDGTEGRADGNWSAAIARYDSFGNLNQFNRVPLPSGYKSASLSNIDLSGN